jgi:hypothetical protein
VVGSSAQPERHQGSTGVPAGGAAAEPDRNTARIAPLIALTSIATGAIHVAAAATLGGNGQTTAFFVGVGAPAGYRTRSTARASVSTTRSACSAVRLLWNGSASVRIDRLGDRQRSSQVAEHLPDVRLQVDRREGLGSQLQSCGESGFRTRLRAVGTGCRTC